RPGRIDVHRIEVVGRAGEFVDAGLVDGEPVGEPDLLADSVGEGEHDWGFHGRRIGEKTHRRTGEDRSFSPIRLCACSPYLSGMATRTTPRARASTRLDKAALLDMYRLIYL